MFSLSLSLSLSVIMFAADWRGCFQQYGQKEYFVFYSLSFFFFFPRGCFIIITTTTSTIILYYSEGFLFT
jgi:hypothetical protein